MRKYLLLSITSVLSLGVASAITWFKEWNSAIWGIPTSLVAFFLGAVAVGIARKVFKPDTIPLTWLVAIVGGYVLLSMLLGTIFAEPISSAASSPYDHTRSSSVYHAIFVGTSSAGESESTTTDIHTSRSRKGGGIVVLLIIALVLLLGSAVIPHFWIAATFMGIALLSFFTWREFQGRRGDSPTFSSALMDSVGRVVILRRADRGSNEKEPALTDSASSVAIHLRLGSSVGEAFARFWNEQLAEDEHIPPEFRPALQAKFSPQQGRSDGSGRTKPALVTIGGMEGEPLCERCADGTGAGADTSLWIKLSTAGLIDPTTGLRVGIGTFLWTKLRAFFQQYQMPSVQQEPLVITIEALDIEIEFDPRSMGPEPPESLKLAL